MVDARTIVPVSHALESGDAGHLLRKTGQQAGQGRDGRPSIPHRTDSRNWDTERHTSGTVLSRSAVLPRRGERQRASTQIRSSHPRRKWAEARAYFSGSGPTRRRIAICLSGLGAQGQGAWVMAGNPPL